MTTVTINVRGLPEDTLHLLRAGAGARGWTYAEYISALVALHQGLMAGQREIPSLRYSIAETLAALRLQEVRA